jgi:hypothetical protein
MRGIVPLHLEMLKRDMVGKGQSPDVHDMTMLSLHAGLRFGEIASLLSENRLKDAAKALGAARKDHTEQEPACQVVNTGK